MLRATIAVIFLSLLGYCERASEYYLGGIQIYEHDQEKWANSLKHHGFNTVQVTTYAKQGIWNSTDLNFPEEYPDVLRKIKGAKSNGLKVVFIPRVALDQSLPENQHLWHGMIMPKTDQQLREWFQKYQEFLVGLAKICEREKVEVFALGSEMKALTNTLYKIHGQIDQASDGLVGWYETYPDKISLASGDQKLIDQYQEYYISLSKAHIAWANEVFYLKDPFLNTYVVQKRRMLLQELWKETVAELRTVFSGKLTYAANFDEYQNAGLWPLIDLMGINAYFPLRKNSSVLTQEGLDEAWVERLRQINEVREKRGVTSQPVIFTELGYTYKSNSSVSPWAYQGTSIVENKETETAQLYEWGEQDNNYKERTMCLEALQKAAHLPGNTFLRGILYWKLSTDKGHEKIEPYVLDISPESKDQALTPLKELFSR